MNLDDYPEAVRGLLVPWRDPPLDAGRPDAAVRRRLAALDPAAVVVGPTVVGPTVDGSSGDGSSVDAAAAAACLSGLWLYHDFLDESHRLSQEIETPTGSFWHGIMHRREGDYDNAKYWFRRVGEHPAFAPLHAAARAALPTAAPRELRTLVDAPRWDPYRFIDLCQAACSGRSDLAAGCRGVQACEWRALFDFCFHAARRQT